MLLHELLRQIFEHGAEELAKVPGCLFVEDWCADTLSDDLVVGIECGMDAELLVGLSLKADCVEND